MVFLINRGVEGFVCLAAEHTFTPADQSVVKSDTEVENQEKSCGGNGGSEERTPRTSEDSALPKSGREKLASLLADLLGFPAADRRQPEAKADDRLNLYESMSPMFGNEPKPAPSGTCGASRLAQRDAAAVIYENCSKCRAECCRPPPRPARKVFTLQSFVSALQPRENQRQAVSAAEEEEEEGDGVSGEGKREAS